MIKNVNVQVRGKKGMKNKLLRIQRKTFEAWKKRIIDRMQQMADEINQEYGELGSGGLSDAMEIKEEPNAVSMTTGTMIPIYLDWGTKAHGPVSAKALHFWIDGVEIVTMWVQGVKEHKIIQRAVDRFKSDLQGWFGG